MKRIRREQRRLSVHWCWAAWVMGMGAVAPVWGQVSVERWKLLPVDGGSGHRFGVSVAADGGVAVIGAYTAPRNATGRAYLFDLETGQQLFRLDASDGAEFDRFGSAVAIDNGIAVVGAPDDDDLGNASGAVYLYEVATGNQIAKLLPSDGGELSLFGRCVALQDGLLAVGARNGFSGGAVYLFDASTGRELLKLTANRLFESFGTSVAVGGGFVAVGAPDAGEVDFEKHGRVYLYDSTTGELARIIQGGGLLPFANFGWSVTIGDGMLAVGAPYRNTQWHLPLGYLFDLASGQELAKLEPSDAAIFDRAGMSISLSNGLVVMGAQADDDYGDNSGAAYLFEASSGTQLAKLLPSDGSAGDVFGIAVAIDDGRIVVAASEDDDNGGQSGSAYVLDAVCSVDFTGDRVVDTRDVIAFLSAWVARHPRANWKVDGVIDSQDVIAYLTSWVSGC